MAGRLLPLALTLACAALRAQDTAAGGKDGPDPAGARPSLAPAEPVTQLEFPGGAGPGSGLHVVLVAGDEEYRSEEALPLLARLLSAQLGFRATVLFSQDPPGTINPDARGEIPGLSALDDADLLVLFTRFRCLPDADMERIVGYVASGRPICAIRTATHAFAYEGDSTSPYAAWSWDSTAWPGGFGRQVLGETWVAHHGHHGQESTRGVIPVAVRAHPVLRGVADVWGATDVYAIGDLPPDATVLLEGEVLSGMSPDAAPVTDGRNSPRMPVAWLRERPLDGAPLPGTEPGATSAGARRGATQRIATATIGAAIDLRCEDLRRFYANACLWLVRREDRIPERLEVPLPAGWEPTMFGFGGYRKGVRVGDLPGAATGPASPPDDGGR